MLARRYYKVNPQRDTSIHDESKQNPCRKPMSTRGYEIRSNEDAWFHAVLRHSGAAIPLVLAFAVCAFFIATLYLQARVSNHRIAKAKIAQLQALLNARSGVWIAYQRMTGNVDSVQAEMDSANASAMRRGDDSGFTSSNPTASVQSVNEIFPFSDSTFGSCSFLYDVAGSFLRVSSNGKCRTKQATVTASLGSRPFTSPDTVLFCATNGLPAGRGNITGTVCFLSLANTVVAINNTLYRRMRVDEKWKQYCEQSMRNELSMAATLFEQLAPVVVSSNDSIKSLPDVVAASLVIEAKNGEVKFNGSRKILVLGDLLFSGEPDVTGLEFRVKGEIQVFDKTKLLNVTLFSEKRIFFAGSSEFSGNASSFGDIEIYERAMITGKSTILSYGSAERDGKRETPFSIHIRDFAMVDGVVVDLNPKRGVETFTNTKVQGVLWSAGALCHEGQLAGVACAYILADRAAASEIASQLNQGSDVVLPGMTNVMNGYIQPLADIASYRMPFFIAKPEIVDWHERVGTESKDTTDESQ